MSINFATRDGIIIELQNQTSFEGAYQTFFDCSWISRFGEENESLFVAGYKRIIIESIRIVETANNYQEFFHSFHLFDCMISGVDMRWNEPHINASDKSLLDRLIHYELYGESCGFDEYIKCVFHVFLTTKTKIKLNMNYVHGFFGKLKYNQLLFDSVSNVLKTDILRIFANLKRVIILNRMCSKPNMDLLSFLTSIESFNLSVTYTINAYQLKDEITESIKREFNNRKWDIKFEKKQGSDCFDTAIITKCE